MAVGAASGHGNIVADLLPRHPISIRFVVPSAEEGYPAPEKPEKEDKGEKGTPKNGETPAFGLFAAEN